LRRYGYRTAALYPPAILYVDGANFDVLRERGFGFEYRKEMFASAAERVEQLDHYLRGVEPGHPLFVWVHLFEPHEPYEPLPEFRQGDSPRALYDGEVRAADRSIAQLVRAFRGARPDATVIVSADHGEEFGEHGGAYHGSTLYDEQVRIPLLWSSPGVVKPGVLDAPVELVDVGSTLLSAAGVPREARMRGDDLSGLLAGDRTAAPEFAFASVEKRHMATDGRLKTICVAEAALCQLYDLTADPAEQHNLAEQRPGDVQRMRAAMEGFFASIPQREALAMAQGVGFPEALARAQLGVVSAAPELLPLLADERASIRAAAARSLGQLAYAPALPLLERLRQDDPDSEVRAEAAVAALTLGSHEAVSAVVALLQAGGSGAPPDGEARARTRRAALALARAKQPAALPALAHLAEDEGAAEAERLQAVQAIAALGEPSSVAVLTPLLDEVRLREAVAVALGQLGGTQARAALLSQLAEERYEPARRAEASALVQLRERKVIPLTLRFLGMHSSLPGGVRLLMELGVLAPGNPYGGLVRELVLRRSEWDCPASAAPGSAEGCRPLSEADLSLPAALGPRLVTWLVHAPESGGTLTLDGQSLPVRPGEQQLSVLRPKRSPARVRVSVQGEVRLIAAVSLAPVPELPPPPKEPWDGGAAEDAGVAAAADSP
jgi:hypothetical protein